MASPRKWADGSTAAEAYSTFPATSSISLVISPRKMVGGRFIGFANAWQKTLIFATLANPYRGGSGAADGAAFDVAAVALGLHLEAGLVVRHPSKTV